MSGRDLPGVSSSIRTDLAPVSRVSVDDQGLVEALACSASLPDGHEAEQARPCNGLPASAIHELRTPLTSIHGYAQVLQRTLRNEPRAANALKVVVTESTRLSAMLAALSELADLEAGDIVSKSVEVEVEQIVDGVVREVVRRDSAQHPIEVTGTAVAHCNPTLLGQALMHVITNATRYSADGAPVTVEVRQQVHTVEVCVQDAGVGIEPADVECVYLPFTRGSNARQTGVRGLGLGLFLARRALEETGGTISHRARVGGGTAFIIELPCA